MAPIRPPKTARNFPPSRARADLERASKKVDRTADAYLAALNERAELAWRARHEAGLSWQELADALGGIARTTAKDLVEKWQRARDTGTELRLGA